MPILLDALLPSSLRVFYVMLLKITDLNPFAAFGLSCADHALRSFGTLLIFAMVAPLTVSAVLAAFMLMQVRVFGRDFAKSFSRYAHLQLILLFLVLPGASTGVSCALHCEVPLSQA